MSATWETHREACHDCKRARWFGERCEEGKRIHNDEGRHARAIPRPRTTESPPVVAVCPRCRTVLEKAPGGWRCTNERCGRRDGPSYLTGDDHEREKARASYLASGGVESDLGEHAREAGWYWRRAAMAWQERAESLGRKFARLADAWALYAFRKRPDTAEKHVPDCPASAAYDYRSPQPECNCGLRAILKELSNGVGLAPPSSFEGSTPDEKRAKREEKVNLVGSGFTLDPNDVVTARIGTDRMRIALVRGAHVYIFDHCKPDDVPDSNDDLMRMADVVVDLHIAAVTKNRNGFVTASRWMYRAIDAGTALAEKLVAEEEKKRIDAQAERAAKHQREVMPDPVTDPAAYEDAMREDRERPRILNEHEVECCRRIGRDEVRRTIDIGLPEMDALCATAIHYMKLYARIDAMLAKRLEECFCAKGDAPCKTCMETARIRGAIKGLAERTQVPVSALAHPASDGPETTTAPAERTRGLAERLEALRADGWTVAVHNDYRQHGMGRTFWLFTHPSGVWAKGEGTTDEYALEGVETQARARLQWAKAWGRA